MSHMNRRWAIIFLGLAVVFGLAMSASAQEQARPNGDIVFIIDESGSMFNDAAVVQRNLQAIVDTLQGRINYQLALVGFGAFKGHSDTEFEGQPHVHLKLTGDVATFRRALDSFVTVGQLEPGFNAIQHAMNADLGYRADAGTCAVLISDEGADIYAEAPTTKAEALQALQYRGASLIGIVNWGETVDPGFDVDQRDYGPRPGGLIPEAGGKAFNVVDFRNDPAPVLRAVMEDCMTAIKTGSLQDSSQPELPGGSAEGQPQPSVGFILERLRAQVETNSSQLFQLRNGVQAWTRELSSLRTTVSQLAERVPAQVTVQISSIQQSVQRISSRFEELRTRVDQLQSELQQSQNGEAVSAMQSKLSDLEMKLQQLRGVVGDLQQRPALTDRVAQLERDVASLDDQAMTVEIRQEFESLRQSFQASLQETHSSLETIDKRLTGISDTVARIGEGQQDQAARLETLAAQLADVQSRVDGLPIGALQERISAAEQAISQLQSHAGQTDQRLNEVEKELASLAQSFEGLSSLPNDVVQLRSSLGELDQRISQRLDELTSRISANETAMGELEQRIEGTTAVTDKYMDNYAKVMQRLDALQADFEVLRQSPSVSPEDLKALGDRVSGNESAIGRLNDDLGALQEQMNGLSDALDARSGELEQAIGDLRTQWSELSDAFESSNANISDRLNALTTRQKQVETRLGQLQDALGQMEQIRTQLGQLRQRLDDLEPRVAANEEGVGTNVDAIADLQSRIGSLEETVNGQLGNVDGRLSDLQDQLDSQGRAIDDLNARLDGLSDDVKQELLNELQQQGGVVRVEVQEDLLTRRLAQIALAFSLAAIGVAWFLFMNR